MAWTIRYRQFPITVLGVDVATHGMLVTYNDTGQVQGIYEGLATGSDGMPKTIGTLPTDTIRYYKDDELSWGRYRASAGTPEQVLFSGTEQEVKSKMDLADAIGRKIDDKNIGYPPLGVFGIFSKNILDFDFDIKNSNAVISTIIKGLGIETEYPDRWSPGTDILLLKPEEWNAIRSKFGLGAISSAEDIFFGTERNVAKWSSL